MASSSIPSPHLMSVSSRPDVVMVRGRGSRLWDSEGREYLDFVQGWAVNCLGHCAEPVQRALGEQAALLINASPAFHTEPAHRLADALCRVCSLDRVFFCSTGAEANESAIKLARKWGRQQRGGAFEIITTEGAFHGRTLATMAASGKPGWDDLFPPVMPGFVKVPFGNARAVREAIGDRTVAVMVEPIQGEAGVVVPPSGYLGELRQLTREAGVLLIVDEVQTGMGRTGRLFAHQAEGIEPDVMTLGKGLGGGVPLSAMLARREVCRFEPGEQGGTFNGNSILCAVGEAVLDVVGREDFLAAVTARGERLAGALGALAEAHDCPEVRGRGLLMALRLGDERAPQVVDRCRERGLLINAPQPDLIRLMPALNVSDSQIDQVQEVLGAALAET